MSSELHYVIETSSDRAFEKLRSVGGWLDDYRTLSAFLGEYDDYWRSWEGVLPNTQENVIIELDHNGIVCVAWTPFGCSYRSVAHQRSPADDIAVNAVRAWERSLVEVFPDCRIACLCEPELGEWESKGHEKWRADPSQVNCFFDWLNTLETSRWCLISE